jgi:hypothetical protein
MATETIEKIFKYCGDKDAHYTRIFRLMEREKDAGKRKAMSVAFAGIRAAYRAWDKVAESK